MNKPKYTPYRTLTRQDVESIFSYDPLTGVFTRKKSGRMVQIRESFDDKVPLLCFTYKGNNYRAPAHTIAWLLHYGIFPEGVILHRDLNRYNLKINNLLDVSYKHLKAFMTAHKNLNENCKVLLHPKDNYKFLVGFLIDSEMKYKTFDDDSAAKEYIKIKRRSLIKQIRLLGGIIPENYMTEFDLL